MHGFCENLLNAAQQDEDIGAQAILEQYAEQRQKDHDMVINFTDSLVKLFSNQHLSLLKPCPATGCNWCTALPIITTRPECMDFARTRLSGKERLGAVKLKRPNL
jgi:hypothetical protein